MPVKGSVPFQPSYLKPNSPLPLYYQLIELIKARIESGEYKVHDRLPSERQLHEQYRVSRMTARRAIEELELEGYVYRRQGLGTFVAEPKLRQGLLRLTSFTEDMSDRRASAGARVLDVEVLRDAEEIQKRLGAAPTEHVAKIHRLRLADDIPMALETSFLRHQFCPGIEEFSFENQSLYQTLDEHFGVQLGHAEQSLEAKIADDYEADQLGVNIEAPMLLMERTTYLDNGVTPVEFVRSTYRGDRYKFYVEMKR